MFPASLPLSTNAHQSPPARSPFQVPSKSEGSESTHQPDKCEPILPPRILRQEFVCAQVREEPNASDACQRERGRLSEYGRCGGHLERRICESLLSGSGER